MNTITKNNPYKALQYKEFKYYIFARFLITIGLSIQAVVIGWQIYYLTNSKLMLGLIGLTEAIPAIGIAMYGGYLADKSEKRSLLAACISLYVLSGLLLLLFTSSYFITNFGTKSAIIFIFIVIFLTGIFRGLGGPTSFSLSMQLIPKDVYQNATTWSSTAWMSGSVLGPILGGFLYAYFGITGTFLVMTILLLLGFVFIFLIEKKPIQYIKKEETVLESAMEGLKFVFNNKIILSAISLDLFAVLFGGAVALLPVFANDILKVGAQGLGIMRAAPAVGAIVTLVLLAYFPIYKNAGLKLLFAVFGFGLFTIIFAVSKNYYFSVFCLFMIGALDGISVAIRHIIIQIYTPDEMRGRVSAVNSMFVGSSNEIGEFESGTTAHWFGTVPAVVVGGCMTILVVITTYVISPTIRKLKLDKS